MATQGTTTVDFGAFPGSAHASVAVTGQTSITSGALVEAWIFPTATADHSADEHRVEPLKVFAGDVVGGVGFTIDAFSDTRLSEPLTAPGVARNHIASGTVGQNTYLANTAPSVGGNLPMVYGQWTVAWVWNN